MAPVNRAVPPTPTLARQAGFTLTELAIVMFIVALLIGGMLLPMSAQRDVRALNETDKLLVEAREQVLGFAAVNQRLPCPASDASNGRELFCSNESGACTETTTYPVHGRCAHPYDGFLPAASLGFFPIDAQGYAVEGWGDNAANRLRYAVADITYTPAAATTRCQATGPSLDAMRPFTCSEGLREIYQQPAVAPDLRICSAAANVTNEGTANADCSAGNALATDVAVVIYSLGKNAGSGGATGDENHNPNPLSTIAADRVFVRGAVSGGFDDQILWISRSMLQGRMIAAGRLP